MSFLSSDLLKTHRSVTNDRPIVAVILAQLSELSETDSHSDPVRDPFAIRLTCVLLRNDVVFVPRVPKTFQAFPCPMRSHGVHTVFPRPGVPVFPFLKRSHGVPKVYPCPRRITATLEKALGTLWERLGHGGNDSKPKDRIFFPDPRPATAFWELAGYSANYKTRTKAPV
jgi:hypothetical protein